MAAYGHAVNKVPPIRFPIQALLHLYLAYVYKGMFTHRAAWSNFRLDCLREKPRGHCKMSAVFATD